VDISLCRQKTLREGVLKHIRTATAEEVESIKDRADLMPGGTTVLALDAEKGTPDIAVIRHCVEVNPIIYGTETNDMRRTRLLWGLEERLLGAGVDRYYFMIDASKADYIKTVKHWGAEQVSLQPEFRFLKVIS
jgi:hypothetical protein